MLPETIRKINTLNEMMRSDGNGYLRVWKEEVLFTWQWWLLALLTVLPWAIWIAWHKRESTNRLLYVGFFSIIVASLLDVAGTTFGLWEYTATVIPMEPPLFPWDMTLMPVALMAFLQFKPNVNKYIKAVVFAALGAFLIEQGAEWIGLYEALLWKHVYSFPFFIAIYLAADWLARRERFEHIPTEKVNDKRKPGFK